MKKAILAVLFAGVIQIVFAQNGVIKELTGTVEIKHAGAANYAAAAAGTQVKADTVISTGFKSTALVEVGSAIITVRPLTRLTLNEISAQAGTENINLSLQTGRVRVDVNPPAGSKATLQVSSPSATASVRGTSFYFDTMNVSVREGIVDFKGKIGYTVQVGAGSYSGIDSHNVAAAAQSITGLIPQSPVGYEPMTGNLGGTVVVNTPKKPSTPSTPNTPDTPSTPSTPGTPSTPSTPGTPSEPGDGGFGVNVEF